MQFFNHAGRKPLIYTDLSMSRNQHAELKHAQCSVSNLLFLHTWGGMDGSHKCQLLINGKTNFLQGKKTQKCKTLMAGNNVILYVSCNLTITCNITYSVAIYCKYSTLSVQNPMCQTNWMTHNWGCNLLTLHYSPFLSCRGIVRHRARDREGLHPDLFWIERGWHPVCPTICVMFLASHQALLSGNSARRLMCAGGAAEYSANSAQQIWILCHMTAPKGAENHSMLPLC